MSESKNSYFHKLSKVEKWILITVSILTGIGAIIKIASEAKDFMKSSFKDFANQIAVESALETRDQIKSLGFLTVDEYKAGTESLRMEMEIDRAVNDTFHRNLFLGQRQIIYAIDDAKYSDSSIQRRIDELKIKLDKLQGIAELTREEQEAQAYTDSLIGENIMLKQKELFRQRNRSDELEFDRLRKEIRDLSKDTVIDKGRKKTIRTKPKGAKQGPVTKGDRNLFEF